MESFIGTREQDAIAQDQAGPSCDNDGGYFQGAMYPDHQDRLPAQSFRKKIILESAQHDPILKQLPYGPYGDDKAGNKYHKSYFDIVNGNPGEHAEWILAFIDSERVSPGDIVFGHVYITVAQDSPHEC